MQITEFRQTPLVMEYRTTWLRSFCAVKSGPAMLKSSFRWRISANMLERCAALNADHIRDRKGVRKPEGERFRFYEGPYTSGKSQSKSYSRSFLAWRVCRNACWRLETASLQKPRPTTS